MIIPMKKYLTSILCLLVFSVYSQTDSSLHTIKIVKSKCEGYVYVSFVAQINGEITDLKVDSGLSFYCDSLAMKVAKKRIKKMQQNSQGKKSDAAIKFTMPIRFKEDE